MKSIDDKPTVKTFKYRYFCHACTGRAFFADEPVKFKGVRVCKNCGAELTYESDKWIACEN